MNENIKTKNLLGFTVIMPTYNQSGFIRNAVRSLLGQTHTRWELIIVDDGSTDRTESLIQDYLIDSRIRYLRNSVNMGIGYSINRAIDIASYAYIAYLPSDDFYYSNHLQIMNDIFSQNIDIVFVTSGLKSETKDSLINRKINTVNGLPSHYWIQLVQCAHKKTSDRWTERCEWVSEDYYTTFWNKLINKGLFINSKEVTCQWTVHPSQRHKMLSETFRGHINKYRQYYQVKSPLKVRVSDHKFVDEEKQYATVINTKQHPTKKGLKILLVGELSYNPERICALEEAGHTLFGLWTKNPAYSFSNVGPLPFGSITDLDYDNWEEEINRINPDIIYALLNYCSVSLAHKVVKKIRNIPFVWHFKEGPFMCLEHGLWNKLVELFLLSDGVIYLNEEIKKWYQQYIPERPLSMILDGDLPKQDYFKDCFSPKLSSTDGEIHTVIPGRIIGITINDINELAKKKIHIHLYNESYEKSWKKYIDDALAIAPGFFHVHQHCDAVNWTQEFSQYDAGWLHCINSNNYGHIDQMGWNDLNIPARVSTLMAAGIPCIQKDNRHHIVAMQSCVRNINCGIFYTSVDNLAVQLYDKEKMADLNKNILRHRMSFSFDYHVQQLTTFFYDVIKNKKRN